MKEAIFEKLVKSTINEYIDKNAIMPLKKYLDKTPKRYKTTNFNKLWHKYETDRANITSRHAFSKHEVFKNNWVIHFTRSPLSIIRNGFKGINVNYKDQLWRTYMRGYPTDYGDGYAFAYDANDIPKNAFEYGEYGIMFRTSGLKVYNRADLGEWQVIFNPSQANLKECFLIKVDIDYKSNYDGDGDFETKETMRNVNVINPYTKKVIYKTNSFDNAVNWVKTNYRQYSSINASKYSNKFKEYYANQLKDVNSMAEYIKSNVNGDVLELPIDDRDIFYRRTILYDGQLNFRDFIKKFGFDFDGKENCYINGDIVLLKEPFIEAYELQCWREHYKREPNDDFSNTITITLKKEI
jgi:hypothetical protein